MPVLIHSAGASPEEFDPAGSAQAVRQELTAHTGRGDNPHSVTLAQLGGAAAGHTHTAAEVGADPAGSAAGVQNSLNWHAGRADNPHGVTAAQAGADPAGSAAGVQYNLNSFAARRDNPHGVTAAQVGAAAAGHTHTASQVGAATAGHTHTAAQVGAIPSLTGIIISDESAITVSAGSTISSRITKPNYIPLSLHITSVTANDMDNITWYFSHTLNGAYGEDYFVKFRNTATKSIRFSYQIVYGYTTQ